jgi:hypothetical protein|tara:strand:- start:163 stop:588 length:426 start_codon:yes stop_codon:yes gene_type:complete
MKYKFPKVKLNKGGNFGPTENDNFYHPVFYHNKTAKKNSDKTKWVLKKNEQYEVFRLSDEGNWDCKEKSGLFGILKNGDIVLGNGEERLSFFPNPANSNDPWHGYPINGGEFEPSIKTVDKWLKDKVIDNRMHIKILKGDI